ncbi:hypothetical protein D477_004916 [Arthrobacter crystallopoietes BAB-32]|uniref:Uncharacterized protein n=1 Tax=Arthrobacter crystallopoietes BAB-32 TaxID=1246476 RepID=N1UY93_9MICC|nr:hypothetical protein D477_004916 [Arthrobacter crystallopoietes BAB-32]
MAVFEIEMYGVAQGRSATAPATLINVYGKVAASGHRNSAQLFYSPTYSALSGVVHNVGVSTSGIQILAGLPYEDFTRMYDILRNEAPVHLWSDYGASPSTSKPLNFVGILSGSSEKPGEGMSDPDSVKQFIRLASEDLPGSSST